MVDRQEVPREVVQTILAMATEGGPVPVPPPILAALCRAWLAVDGGQVEIEALRAEREVIGAEALKYAGKSGRLEAKVERLAEALRIAEAALADIGDADREPGDDVAWCERRARLGLRVVRDTLRDHDQEVGNG